MAQMLHDCLNVEFCVGGEDEPTTQGFGESYGDPLNMDSP